MEKKIFTIAIIGLGGRGADSYGSLINERKDCFKITAICDLKQEKLDSCKVAYGLTDADCFLSEEEFFQEKRADLLLIATPDNDHVKHCLKAFALGYHVMTEKPLTEHREECYQLLEAQKKAGTKALVCHVLRYAPAFVRAAEILKSGAIGKLVLINALERVGHEHQAHSYVRGNWRNRKVAAPMILAKCCHDLDLLQYYAQSKCESISSIGDLVYFKPENAPEGATKRCLDCPHKEVCKYSAWRQYIDGWINGANRDENRWPYNIVVNAPVTEEKLMTALREGPYGRCVYFSDNDVVDHQLTQMTFENGVKAALTMTAFTAGGGRRIHFHGTLGELILEEADNTLTLRKFWELPEVINLADLTEKGYGHGGGDNGLVTELYAILTGESTAATALDASVESHLMGICAEESRLQNGKLMYVHKEN